MRPYRIFGPYGRQLQNEFIANALLVLLPLFMILLLRMGLLYYRFASDNHLKNILHILLIVSFLTSITGSPQRAEAQTPDPGTLVFYHTDHLGSTTAITDASGNVLQLLEYDPWGQVVKDIGDNYAHYRYTGQEFDPEIGLYNYRARLYAPGIGRFISPDPIVGDPMDPQSLNRYSYVLNNPLRYVDPSGYLTWKEFWRKYGGYVVGGLIILATFILTIATGGAAAPLFFGALSGAMIGEEVGGQWGFAIGAFAGALVGWASTGFSTFGLGEETKVIQLAEAESKSKIDITLCRGACKEPAEKISINWTLVKKIVKWSGVGIIAGGGTVGAGYGISLLLGSGTGGSSVSLLTPGMGFGYGVGYGTEALGGYGIEAGAGIGAGGSAAGTAGGGGFTWPFHFLEERIAGVAGISIGLLKIWAGALIVNAGLYGNLGIFAGFIFAGSVTVVAGVGLIGIGLAFVTWGIYNTIYGLEGTPRALKETGYE